MTSRPDPIYAAVPLDETTLDPDSSLGKIQTHVHAGQRVLDVGCGGGRLALHLGAKGATVVGIERQPEAAAQARRFCARVIERDLAEVPLLDSGDYFDVIVFADVLEHLVYPGKVLDGLGAHLAPGGFILVSLPNIAHYLIRLRLLRGSFDYEPWGIMDQSHLRFFTRKTALQLLRDAGFVPVDVDAVYRVPLGRLKRYWPGMHRAVGALAPTLFAYQWVIKASRT